MAQKQSNSPAVTMLVLSLISSRSAHVAHYSSAGGNNTNNGWTPQVLSEDEMQAWTKLLKNFYSTSQHLVAQSQTLGKLNSEDNSTHIETHHGPNWRMDAAKRRYKRHARSDDTFGVWTLPYDGKCVLTHPCDYGVDGPYLCYGSPHACDGNITCDNGTDELYCEDSLLPYMKDNGTYNNPAESSGITWPSMNLKGCARACNDMIDGCIAFAFSNSKVRNRLWRCLTYTRIESNSRRVDERFDTYVRSSPSKPRLLVPPPRNAPATAPASQPTPPASPRLPTDCGQRHLAPQAAPNVRTESKVVQSSISNRIVSGVRVSAGTYPWQMQIQFYDAGSWQHRCGGVLISSRHVLTAAHCVSDHTLKALQVVVGQHNLRIANEPHEQIFAIENMLIHPEYRSITATYANDIALVKLRLRSGRSVQFSPHVQPLCLPPPGTTPPTSTECEISGWGKTGAQSSSTADVLLGGVVPLVSDTFCSSTEVYGTQYLPDKMVCAGFVRGGTDTCQGDSGGPLACQREDGVWMVTGIVSFGDGCGAAVKPGVYTEVSFYVDWIHQVVDVI